MGDFLEQPNSTPTYEHRKFQKQASPLALNMGKVFGYMSLGLLVSAAFAALFGFAIFKACGCERVADGVIYIDNITAYYTFSAFTIIPMIAILVASFMAGSFVFKSGTNTRSRSVAIPFAIYSISIGYVLGLVVPFLPWEVLAITLGVSIAIFGSLALVGGLSKGNLNPLMMCAGALGGGLMLMMMFNLIFMFIFPAMWTAMYWVFSLGIFAVLMLTTTWDVWNIKNIMAQNESTPNLALFCAFRLYVDFIAIFLRILYFVMIMWANNRN